MRRRGICTLLALMTLLLLPCESYAQDLQWVSTVGSPERDEVAGANYDGDGNVVGAGFFSAPADFDPGPGVLQLVPNGSNDGFIVKLDTAGQLLWVNQLTGAGSEHFQALDVAADGAIVAGGGFAGTVDFDPGPGVVELTADASGDRFVARYTSEGDLVWARSFVGNGFDYLTDVVAAPDGSVIVGGYKSGTLDFDPGPGVYQLTGLGTFFVKLDVDGEFVWAVQILGVSPIAVAVDSDANIIATGWFGGNEDFDPGPGVVTLTSDCVDTYVLKLDPDGNFIWAGATRVTSSCGDTGPTVDPFALGVDSNDAIIVTGLFDSPVDFDPGPGTQIVTSITSSVYVWKLDAAGSLLWVVAPEPADSNSWQQPEALAIDGCDGIQIAGRFTGDVDFDPGPGVQMPPTAGSDPFFWKLSSDGGAINIAALSDFGSTHFHALADGSGGRFVAAGYLSGTTDFDPGPGTVSVSSSGGADVLLVEYANALSLRLSNTTLAWSGSTCTQGYDVVAGDLGLLHTSGGDFAQATDVCLADDWMLGGIPLPGDPDPGEAVWFLVREFGRSYDSSGLAQLHPRDEAIAASGVDCSER